MGSWFVYILRCADGTFYTGLTTDTTRRCRQHNDGTAAHYTRSRRPTRLVYREAHPDQGAALRREAAIENLSRPEKEVLIRRARRAHGAG
jgi:predicted GIY-YIG superfamily endonuclease